ncbi:hypothetical protein F8388_016106 [Cannabis sativa]|uniref:F-box domain-containing protein n=1 Tax=Cannabis sativa TaxID=3483 RepID=A0A7J6FKF9_CANSA|nr:hypothetical protein G4B88_001119 [Cannabis sativa]KAF4370369.1 hypothetical protein F8388_016106 [Cannabis sativa]
MRREDIINGVDDHFSYLPQHIVHHIFSFLTTKDVIRTSLLSKHFFHIWCTFPILNFDYELFSTSTYNSSTTCSQRLIKFFETIIASLKRIPQNSCDLDTFTCRFPLTKLPKPNDNIINNVLTYSLEYGIANKVKHLTIECTTRTHQTSNIVVRDQDQDSQETNKPLLPPLLPVEVFSSKWIKTMNLCGISLLNVENSIIIKCPLLEDLIFERCNTTIRPTTILISCPKLKSIKFIDSKDFDTIEMTKDNEVLEWFSFELQGITGRFDGNKIDLQSCKQSLKTLILANTQVSDEWFSEQVSKLISLESLRITCCESLHSLKIGMSNKNLQNMELINCKAMEDIKVVSPSLKYFHYGCLNNRRHNNQILNLNLYECENLKDVRLEGANITNKWIEDHFNPLTGFRILEKFHLFKCNVVEKIEIDYTICNNQYLKSVELVSCYKLSTIKIEAPNLHWFDYDGPTLSSGVLVTSTNNKLEAQITLDRIDKMEEDVWELEECCVQYLVKCWRHNLTKIEVVDDFQDYEERAILLQNYFIENVGIKANFQFNLLI